MAFEELKERHAVIWGNGPFERISATGTIAYDDLVGRLAPEPGERWLDIACGTGAVAFRAAKRGADVTGIDLAPALVTRARELAAESEGDVTLEAESGQEVWELFSTSFGPVKTLNETLEGERREAFEQAFIDFHESYRRDGGIRMPREYLRTIGRRR